MKGHDPRRSNLHSGLRVLIVLIGGLTVKVLIGGLIVNVLIGGLTVIVLIGG